MGVSRYYPNFLSTPIISGTGKATNFKFCTHILSIDRNKSPLQISGKVVGCVVSILKTFQCTHILGPSRGLLCDSSAVLSNVFWITSVFVFVDFTAPLWDKCINQNPQCINKIMLTMQMLPKGGNI